jgi:hypothetical protein
MDSFGVMPLFWQKVAFWILVTTSGSNFANNYKGVPIIESRWGGGPNQFIHTADCSVGEKQNFSVLQQARNTATTTLSSGGLQTSSLVDR